METASGMLATALPGTELKPAKTKSLPRMIAKLETDHQGVKMPQAADNVDCNRVTMIVEAMQLPAAYAAVGAVFGDSIHVEKTISGLLSMAMPRTSTALSSPIMSTTLEKHGANSRTKSKPRPKLA